MSSNFRTRMGLGEIDPKELRDKFLKRISVSLFRWLETNETVRFFDENFIWWISEQMGESWGDTLQLSEFTGGYYTPLTLEIMANRDFYKTLAIIEMCYQYVDEGRAPEKYVRYIANTENKVDTRRFNERMNKIILLSGNIGVFWKDGVFYQSGAKELDQALVSDSLDWLHKYPKTQKQFLVALNHYKRSLEDSSAGKDAITNSYTSMESLAQEFLGNDKNFDKNSDPLVVKLNLPTEYKNIIHYYKQIAHEYSSRHSGSDLIPKEVEAFVYLTGLLLRLISNPQ